MILHVEHEQEQMTDKPTYFYSILDATMQIVAVTRLLSQLSGQLLYEEIQLGIFGNFMEEIDNSWSGVPPEGKDVVYFIDVSSLGFDDFDDIRLKTVHNNSQ